VQAGKGARKDSGQMLASLRREGVPKVRSVLAQFVEDLKNQVGPTGSAA